MNGRSTVYNVLGSRKSSSISGFTNNQQDKYNQPHRLLDAFQNGSLPTGVDNNLSQVSATGNDTIPVLASMRTSSDTMQHLLESIQQVSRTAGHLDGTAVRQNFSSGLQDSFRFQPQQPHATNMSSFANDAMNSVPTAVATGSLDQHQLTGSHLIRSRNMRNQQQQRFGNIDFGGKTANNAPLSTSFNMRRNREFFSNERTGGRGQRPTRKPTRAYYQHRSHHGSDGRSIDDASNTTTSRHVDSRHYGHRQFNRSPNYRRLSKSPTTTGSNRKHTYRDLDAPDPVQAKLDKRRIVSYADMISGNSLVDNDKDSSATGRHHGKRPWSMASDEKSNYMEGYRQRRRPRFQPSLSTADERRSDSATNDDDDEFEASLKELERVNKNSAGGEQTPLSADQILRHLTKSTPPSSKGFRVDSATSNSQQSSQQGLIEAASPRHDRSHDPSPMKSSEHGIDMDVTRKKLLQQHGLIIRNLAFGGNTCTRDFKVRMKQEYGCGRQRAAAYMVPKILSNFHSMVSVVKELIGSYMEKQCAVDSDQMADDISTCDVDHHALSKHRSYEPVWTTDEIRLLLAKRRWLKYHSKARMLDGDRVVLYRAIKNRLKMLIMEAKQKSHCEGKSSSDDSQEEGEISATEEISNRYHLHQLVVPTTATVASVATVDRNHPILAPTSIVTLPASSSHQATVADLFSDYMKSMFPVCTTNTLETIEARSVPLRQLPPPIINQLQQQNASFELEANDNKNNKKDGPLTPSSIALERPACEALHSFSAFMNPFILDKFNKSHMGTPIFNPPEALPNNTCQQQQQQQHHQFPKMPSLDRPTEHMPSQTFQPNAQFPFPIPNNSQAVDIGLMALSRNTAPPTMELMDKSSGSAPITRVNQSLPNPFQNILANPADVMRILNSEQFATALRQFTSNNFNPTPIIPNGNDIFRPIVDEQQNPRMPPPPLPPSSMVSLAGVPPPLGMHDIIREAQAFVRSQLDRGNMNCNNSGSLQQVNHFRHPNHGGTPAATAYEHHQRGAGAGGGGRYHAGMHAAGGHWKERPHHPQQGDPSPFGYAKNHNQLGSSRSNPTADRLVRRSPPPR